MLSSPGVLDCLPVTLLFLSRGVSAWDQLTKPLKHVDHLVFSASHPEMCSTGYALTTLITQILRNRYDCSEAEVHFDWSMSFFFLFWNRNDLKYLKIKLWDVKDMTKKQELRSNQDTMLLSARWSIRSVCECRSWSWVTVGLEREREPGLLGVLGPSLNSSSCWTGRRCL